jgi:hypothetical protein
MLRHLIFGLMLALCVLSTPQATASGVSVGALISGEVKIGGNRAILLPPGSWTIRGSFDTSTPLTPAPGATGVPPSQKVRNLVLTPADGNSPVSVMTLQWTEFARVNWTGQPCSTGSMSARPFKNSLDTSANSTRVKCVAGTPMEDFPDRVRRGANSNEAAVRMNTAALQAVVNSTLHSNAFTVYGYMSQVNGDRVSWHIYFNLDRLGLDRPGDLALDASSNPASSFLRTAASEMMEWSTRYLAGVEAGFWPSLFSSKQALAPAWPGTSKFVRSEPANPRISQAATAGAPAQPPAEPPQAAQRTPFALPAPAVASPLAAQPAPVAASASSPAPSALLSNRSESSATPPPAAGPSSERRVALVIGNAAYRTAPLRNPANDAEDMAEALKALDFEVLQARNSSLREMRSIMRRFSDEIETSNVALVYYAGHGIELNGRNYLIPTDADIQREYEIADQAFDAGLILSMLDESSHRNRKRVNIVILDACRNNDLPRSLRNVRSGLARMDAPVGTFIAFSTSPGRVALDGDGRNSPFTQSLLASIREPDQSIEQVFKNVRRAVVDQTNGSQIPWESSSLIGDFYFRSQTRR